MTSSLFDLSDCYIFCAKKTNLPILLDFTHPIMNPLAITQLNITDGEVLVPDGIVARKGFGHSFHRMLVGIATDLGYSLTTTRDGGARGGALTVWSKFFNDASLDKVSIESIDDEIDWTNPEDNPEFFHAYRSTKNPYRPAAEQLPRGTVSICYDAELNEFDRVIAAE